jgi:uncharacterized membrane protein
MLLDVLYFFAGSFLNIIGLLFGLLNFVFPTQQVTNSIVFFFGYLRPFGAFIDLATFSDVIGSFLTFLTFWYSYKLILAILNWLPIPWVHPNHPIT